jgi:iron complex transport system substrate-binding protein
LRWLRLPPTPALPLKGGGRRQAPLALFFVLLLLSGPAHAARVVSLNLCTDDYLVLLAPESVVALSPLARDPTESVVAEAARHLPWVRADAEAILALRPDLVLGGPYGAQTTLATLARHGLRIERTGLPQDFAAIRDEARRMAAVLGVPASGEAMLRRMDAELASIPPRPPVRALYLGARGYEAGAATLEAAVLRAAVLTNAGADGRPGLEAVVANPPQLLIVPQVPRFPSLATELLQHPALAAIPRRIVPPALLACAGPWTAEAAVLLAQ